VTSLFLLNYFMSDRFSNQRRSLMTNPELCGVSAPGPMPACAFAFRLIALNRQDRPKAAQDRPESNCIDEKGTATATPVSAVPKRDPVPLIENLEQPCTDQLDFYHDKSQTATSELHLG
jgi:hypothetical protein